MHASLIQSGTVQLGSSARRMTRVRPLVFLPVYVLLHALPIAAQQPDAQSVALAMQEVVSMTIARSERSVVAIARVRKDEADAVATLPLPFGLQRGGNSPTDPDFIPLEYGAGVVVDGEDGLIVTTLHVLGDLETSEHFVWSQKRPFKADVVATSPWLDLAVLKVDAEGLLSMPLGDASALKKGHIVLALGNPYAIARDGSLSASWGFVSNLNRSAPRIPTRSKDSQGRETLHHFGTLIHTDAKLAFGYSGGALLNLEGEMVGLTTSLTASPRHEASAGLAIPVDATFKRVLEALKRGEAPEFGFLGVGPATLSTNLRQLGHHGARVDTVIEGTPAAKADVRPDDVITHVNGRPIYGDSDLFRAVGQAAPGTILSLTVVRGDIAANDKQIETEVAVSKKFVNTIRKPVSTKIQPVWRGLRVDYATASESFARQLPRPPADSLVVTTVVEGSPAWESGLQPGDFITHTGDLQVTTPKEFAAAVAEVSGEVTLHLVAADGTTTPRTVSP